MWKQWKERVVWKVASVLTSMYMQHMKFVTSIYILKRNHFKIEIYLRNLAYLFYNYFNKS